MLKIFKSRKLNYSVFYSVIKRFDTKNTNTKKLKKSYQGRHKSLTERDECKLKRAIIQLREKSPNFTVMEVVQCSGISPTIATYRTFLQYVKRLGYGFFQSRKKGVLTKKDLKIRRKFARSMATKPQDYWTSDVSFYLDGVSFIYKSNPRSDVLKPKNRAWRKRGEGLLLTTKVAKNLLAVKDCIC